MRLTEKPCRPGAWSSPHISVPLSVLYCFPAPDLTSRAAQNGQLSAAVGAIKEKGGSEIGRLADRTLQLVIAERIKLVGRSIRLPDKTLSHTGRHT